jgi:hypothetical protein
MNPATRIDPFKLIAIVTLIISFAAMVLRGN